MPTDCMGAGSTAAIGVSMATGGLAKAVGAAGAAGGAVGVADERRLSRRELRSRGGP